MDKKWWKEAAVYQIYPKSFCDSDNDGIGDLNGIISKLGYIKGLGVDVIWLSPIYKSPDKDNGYDISDYKNIQPAYGTMADFDRLLTKTHEAGMKLVMDLVINHTSDMHPWYLAAKSDVNSKYHDYYYWRRKPNNWHAYFGGSAWTKSEETGEYSLGVFSPFQPDLNWSNPQLREEVYDIMRFWLDKGIDGFRLDAIQCIGKDPSLGDSADGYPIVNRPVVHDYLFEMNEKVLSKYDIMTVGEAAGITPDDMCKFARSDGKELNMMIQFSHVESDYNENGKWNTDKPDLIKLEKMFDYWQNAIHDKSWISLYWNNHDQPRAVSRLGDDSEKYRELSAKMLAVNTFLMCGTPFIFQGEELGMTNVKWKSADELRDIESINAFHSFVDSGKKSADEMLKCISAKARDNARTPMQWDDSEFSGFSCVEPWSKVNENHTFINAKEQESRKDSVSAFYKQLLKIRKSSDVAVYGAYEGVDIGNKSVFAYKRTLGRKEMLVLCSFANEEVGFDFADYIGGELSVLIDNYGTTQYLKTKKLKPYECAAILNEKNA